MSTASIIMTLVALGLAAFWSARSRAYAIVDGDQTKLRARPHYFGYRAAIWSAVPALLVLAAWNLGETEVLTGLVVEDMPADLRELPGQQLALVVNDVRNLAKGGIASDANNPAIIEAAERFRVLSEQSRVYMAVAVLAAGLAGWVWAWRGIRVELRARESVEGAVRFFLVASASLAILSTLGIVLSVLFESIRFFQMVSPGNFLFGLEWSPQIAIRADQVGAQGSFGMLPLFAGTLLIAFVAMVVAVPVGLMSAIYLSEFAGARVRAVVKPVLEILAGIPTVVYGFFAVLVVSPFIRDSLAGIGIEASSESALAAGLVMGIMIIPFVSSLSDDVINAVPQAMRDGSYGLGATRSETIVRVVIPAALPGIVSGILLAVSRAVGETMIVVMAAGLSANLTANPLEAVTTVTVQIVTLLVGDQEFDSPKTLAAFALGLVLFVVTLVLNVIALQVVRKYREQYE